MIKKFILMSLVISQLTISCSENIDDEVKPETELTLEEQIANLIKQPYSKLTPSEQKIKLEAEANDLLIQLDKLKTSGAIEALENLSKLLNISPVDIFNGKYHNGIEDIINTAGVYGIYTWNNTEKTWIKTASATELKFVFPAKKTQTTNNASFYTKAIASDVKVKFYDSYNWKTDTQINDWFFLPTSADAFLTIDGAQVGTFSQTAKYSNGKEAPDEFAYKMTLNDGYAWEMNGKKGTQNVSNAILTYNGKTLLNFNGDSSANIDKLIDNEELSQYRGKSNGLIKLMDNFIIVAEMNLASEDADQIALDKNLVKPYYPDPYNPESNYKEYYTEINTHDKKYSEGLAANFNKNLKLSLVSKNDGTKIADIIKRSEQYDGYLFNLPVWNTQHSYWSNNGNGEPFARAYFEEVFYLKFNDNTEVSFSSYFSKGFEKFEAKFEDFIKAFEK